MKQTVLQRISKNLLFKLSAGILGTLFWLKLSHNQMVTCRFEIPLSFYNIEESKKIFAPESIIVHLRGKRTDLYAFDHKQCAIHIDGSDFSTGTHNLSIGSEKLFLPDMLTMVHCNPCKIELY